MTTVLPAISLAEWRWETEERLIEPEPEPDDEPFVH
jgi:hypothetical protein